jgi:DNA helicase-2/ATP-dependent DNA helicase PcrA
LLAEPDFSPSLLVEAVLERTGYLRELDASNDPQDEGRADNLRELLSVAREFESTRAGTDEATSLEAFLEQVSLVADADSIPDSATEGVVTLMTLHTAKGLEYPAVFLTGLEDGVFPHLMALAKPDELAEERRLAYVGITRAQQRLYLSRALSRAVFGTPQWNPPSRFLGEIPAELVQWSGQTDALGPFGDDGFAGGYPGADDDEPSSGRYADHGYRAAPRRPVQIRSVQKRSAQQQLAQSRLARGEAGGPAGGGLRGGVGNRPVPELSKGDRVNHDKFGVGRVLDTRGTDDGAQAQIDFGTGGIKWLVLRFAPLEKL